MASNTNQRHPMKKLLLLMTTVVLHGLLAGHAAAASGFTDSAVTFYGEVRQVSGGRTFLLQAGKLEMTFVNQSNPANKVTLDTDLRPTGEGDNKLFSYTINVPLAYLPEAPRLGDFLAVGAEPTDFRIQEITINGKAATQPDGSKEFYGLSFASRGADHRLDLLTSADTTDSDGDGLPDWWEDLYGFDKGLADSGSDSDDDGWTNLEEFNRGANPLVGNRVPRLATAEILVPQSGEAGVHLHVLDSDTPPDGIEIAITGGENPGFVIHLDGVPLVPGETQQFPLTGLQSGRLTIRNSDQSANRFSLPLSCNDGDATTAGSVIVRVVRPSERDGSDATLWLDGMDLTEDGGGIGSWVDRSGNGRNASQPLPAHQPVVRGHSAHFPAAGAAHLFFQDAAVSAGNHTILASYRAAAASDSPQTLLSTNRGFLQLASTNRAISYPGAPTYQMDGIAVRGFENVTGAGSTSIFRREGNLLENIYGVTYDGRNVAATAIDPVLPTIGTRRSAVPGSSSPVSEGFSGQLHELLVFPSALPEQKLRDVHDYLASKWDGSVIWDLSTELKTVNLAATSGIHPQIIRGGHGDDHLGGGPLGDIISGGPGADTLTGAGGADRFVFGGLDTGKDRITDYHPEHDVIDLSAMFWGRSGDARQFISVRLDANFTTGIPVLDSVLIVARPDGTTQEIVLENTVIGSAQLIQLIVEGRIRMGSLSIPVTVQIALAPGNAPLPTAPDQPFNVVVTRGGEGVSAALDVPLGFFEEALGGKFITDGAASNTGHRSVVSFARGETSRTLTIRPLPDLSAIGPSNVQVAVLPHHKFAVGGGPVERMVIDDPMVSLEIVQANAVSSIAQPARLRVHRDGDLTENLTIDLRLGGTAEEGVHIQQLPDSLTIPAGQGSAEIQIIARAEGLDRGPKVLLFQLASSDRYQLGNPIEAVLYAATTTAGANGAGFDRWLQASTQGAMTSLADLADLPEETAARYLKAYAFGLDSAADLQGDGISFRISNGRPEILARGRFDAADVRWTVESSTSLSDWSDSSARFSEAQDPNGLKLVGEPLTRKATSKFYRLGFNLDPGQLATGSIINLAGTTRFGISGNASWKTDQTNGHLTSSGGNPGDTSRIIAEAGGGTRLDFEMKVAGGGAADMLTFYIDGVRQARTSGATVAVQLELSGPETRLLMWEFKRGAGNAVISNRIK